MVINHYDLIDNRFIVVRKLNYLWIDNSFISHDLTTIHFIGGFQF